jgi:nitrogen fixation NifU-like protein
MKVETMYQEIILDHYRKPRHHGLREPYDVEVHHVNPLCGDEVTLRLELDGDRIREVSFDGHGCSISQASASVMTELVTGRTVDDALRVHGVFLELMQSKGETEPDEDILEDAVAFAGVSKYPARIKCALLGWMAMKDAAAQAMSGNGSKNDGTERLS